MTRPDELDLYRKTLTPRLPQNPRKDADISASLRAFDQAFDKPKRFSWPSWLRLPILISAGGAVAAGLLVMAFLPQTPTKAPNLQIAPPELRLALPEEPPANLHEDVKVLAAFSPDVPQYFPLPWDRTRIIAVLDGTEGDESEEVLFAAAGRRLTVLPRGNELLTSRDQDETYQRFAIAVAGLALLEKGEDLGSDWTKALLLSEAHQAALDFSARQAALSVVSGE